MSAISIGKSNHIAGGVLSITCKSDFWDHRRKGKM